MKVKYILDENVDLEYRAQLLRHAPALTVWAIDDPGAPANFADEYADRISYLPLT